MRRNQRSLPGATHDRDRPAYRCMGFCRRFVPGVPVADPRGPSQGEPLSPLGQVAWSSGRANHIPPGRSMTDSQARAGRSGSPATSAAASSTAAHRRRRHGPAPRRACGARRGDRRHAQAEARVTSPPACAPRGACLRRARLRRLRSGPAAPRARGAVLPVALRSASQADRLREATAAPLRSAHPSRQARRAPVTPRAHSRLRVTAVASLRLESCRGGFAAPEPPAPLRPAGRALDAGGRPCPLRAPRPRRSPWRKRAPGVAPQPWHPTHAWLRDRPGALGPRHHARGCRRPGGPSCSRPLRRGWRRVRSWPRLRPVAVAPRGGVTGRCGGHGSHAGPVPRRAGTAAGARLAGRPGTCSGTTAGASARAPLAGDGLNPARFAPRRSAAGGAGGLTPSPARGSG